MNTGHCSHCHSDCNPCWSNDYHHTNTDESVDWLDGCCPACAEATRVTDALQESLDNARQDEVIGLQVALTVVGRS